MPHLIIEHSANISDEELQPQQLLENLHDAAVSTGLFPAAGIRSRIHRVEHYRVGSGDPSFAFAHLHIRIGAGRSEDDKARAGEALFEVLKKQLAERYDNSGLALSFEINELPACKANHNNLRDYM